MERIVRKDISFVQASLQNFESLTEQSIFNLTLFLIQKALKLSFSNTIKLKLPMIRKFLGSKTTKLNNENIVILLQNLAQKTLILNVLHTHNKYKRIEIMTIFSKIIFNEQKKVVIFHIAPDFLSYFLKKEKDHQLAKSQYVNVLVSITKNAKNKYTPKLFEFLSSYANFSSNKTNNNIIIKLETLKKVFNIKENQYLDFKNFNYFVLKKVQSECKKFDLEFTYSLHRENRKVIAIEFSMTNAAKKKFYKKFKDIHFNEEEDEILLYVRNNIQNENIDFLYEELKHSIIFHEKIARIEPADKFSLYKFVYRNAKTNDGQELYRLVNFTELQTIIEYFTLIDGKHHEDTKLIQDILNEKRA